MGAMEAQLNRNMKSAQMKERIRAKAEAIRISKEKQILKHPNNNDHISDINNNFTDEHIASIFSTGEKVEKTPRSQKQETTSSKTKNKKNKK
jgi:hypothetical protein